MPLRYDKTLRGIFKEILHMQKIGLLDPATDDSLREYLHTHRKALRELQRIADKQQKRRDPNETTKALAKHFSGPQYSVEGA